MCLRQAASLKIPHGWLSPPKGIPVYWSDMKHLRYAMAILLAGGLSITAVSPALASGTAWADTPMLPNPSLANSHVFPASAATAGTAMVSPAADGPLENCSRHSPCAMPAPARDHVAVVNGAGPRPATLPGAGRAQAVKPGLQDKPES
jgi:hypothetical protein